MYKAYLLIFVFLTNANYISNDNITIMFFGDSITAGYGLDKEKAYPKIVENKLSDKGYNVKVINAGLSGETSAGGLTRVDWVLRQEIDIFILELGANDGLRGLPLSQTLENLQEIIDKVKVKYPEAEIVIAGMMVPPNLGDDYTTEFENLYPKLARVNNARYIPFLLEGVAGDSELNLSDGIHPNAEGHKIVAATVIDHIIELL